MQNGWKFGAGSTVMFLAQVEADHSVFRYVLYEALKAGSPAPLVRTVRWTMMDTSRLFFGAGPNPKAQYLVSNSPPNEREENHMLELRVSRLLLEFATNSLSKHALRYPAHPACTEHMVHSL